ncbi:MAG TPA: trypsin-like peptidase domain-containing protein [Spirochaetia bacterium]|nr:trypsin-like peptidase domain-containing protein [Spirochaetia bacterium]
MKLYSSRQVAVLCGVTAACALLVGAAFASLILPPRFPQAARAVMTVQRDSAAAVLPVQFSGSSTRPGALLEDELNNIEIYDRANKAVVYITTVTMEYTWFYEAVPQEGTGSGVIIDQDGHVLTNYHVIKGADKISITLADGTEVPGRITGTDPENDLAVVQFDSRGKSLATIPFGNSASLRVGQKVLAIGNPFGLDRTLTRGVVSGLARPLQTEDGFLIRETIQTDAAINPGNSGGPLLNSHGELIGINSAIKSPSGASAGIGFAVPVSTARRVADELIRYGTVRRGWIDIEPVQLFPALVNYFRLPVDKGILVNTAGVVARQAGLRGGDPSRGVSGGRSTYYPGGDIIIAVNSKQVDTYSDYLNALEDTKPGEVVSVKIVRGGQEKTLTVKLVQAPAPRQ